MSTSAPAAPGPRFQEEAIQRMEKAAERLQRAVREHDEDRRRDALALALEVLSDLRLTSAAIGWVLRPEQPISAATVRDWRRAGGARPAARFDPWPVLRALAARDPEAWGRVEEARVVCPDRRGMRPQNRGCEATCWLTELGAPRGTTLDRLRWLHEQVLEGRLEVRRTA